MYKIGKNRKFKLEKQNLVLYFGKTVAPASLLNPHRGLPSGFSPFGTHSTSN